MRPIHILNIVIICLGIAIATLVFVFSTVFTIPKAPIKTLIKDQEEKTTPIIFKDSKILKNQNSQTIIAPNELPKSKKKDVSLIAVGDIMLSRTVASRIKKNGLDYPYKETQQYLQKGDIVFGNLETAVTPGRTIQPLEMYFRSDPNVLEGLKNSGFDIVSLANNHTPNFGATGLIDTFIYLDEYDILHVGAGVNAQHAYQAQYLEKNNYTFAFLAYNNQNIVPSSYGAGDNDADTAFMDIKKMTIAVQQAKTQADFVIVSMHAGDEYVFTPNQQQIDFAHTAIDAGADVILGHHPHVIQSMEIYKDKLIFYSLGNFVFDQMWSMPTRESIIANLIFSENGVQTIEITPVVIYDYAQPRFVSPDQAKLMIDRMQLPTKSNFNIQIIDMTS